MKKLLIVLLLLLLFSFVGCSTSEKTSSNTEINSSLVIESSSEAISSTDEIPSETGTSSEETVSNEISIETTATTESSQITSTSKATNGTLNKENSNPKPQAEDNSSSEISTNIIRNETTHKEHIDVTNPNEYKDHTWLHNDGVKIKKSDTYVDKYGNVYDYKGDFLYNLSDWFDVVE